MLDSLYYTPEELSKRFRLSLSTIYNLIEKGDLPSVKLGKSYRIPHSALLHYLNTHTQGTKAKAQPILPRSAEKFVRLVEDSRIKSVIDEIILYGSYARGDYNEDSDIDLLVILKKLDSETSDQISGFSDEAMAVTDYDEFLSVIEITEKQWMEAHEMQIPFYKAVLREGISLWKRPSS